jgi:molybdate transport system substrate-binding protein
MSAKWVSLICAALLGAAGAGVGSAGAAEINVLASTALTGIMARLIPDFEHASGHKVTIAYQASGAALARIEKGEVMPDIAIVTGPGVDALISHGKMVAGSRQDIARLGMGVAVRAGAPKPDIGTPEALKQALLAARKIAYSDPAGGGASGILFAKVLDQLGIAEAVRDKTLLTTGPVGAVVASGEAELGVQQIPELKAVPGVEIVGPLPPPLQTITVLSAGVGSGSKQPDAARAFLTFLAAPDAKSVIAATGMEPG